MPNDTVQPLHRSESFVGFQAIPNLGNFMSATSKYKVFVGPTHNESEFYKTEGSDKCFGAGSAAREPGFLNSQFLWMEFHFDGIKYIILKLIRQNGIPTPPLPELISR